MQPASCRLCRLADRSGWKLSAPVRTYSVFVFACHVAKRLSSSPISRVAIARALVHRPRLVVCDEPTAALDARSGRRVMDLLREVAVAPDRACIIVTHDNRIFDLADRILRLEDGSITHDGAHMPEDH